ncbi:conserved hypothetical protein, partial [Ricinus communis]
MVVHGPAGRRQHQVAGLPLVAVARHHAVARARKVVVDGCRYVAMRTVDDLRRTNCHRGEEVRRDAVGAARHRVVHHVQAAADVVAAQRLEL